MRYYCPSAIFDYLGGQMGGQNGRKSANIEVKNKKSAKMDEILMIEMVLFTSYICR